MKQSEDVEEESWETWRQGSLRDIDVVGETSESGLYQVAIIPPILGYPESLATRSIPLPLIVAKEYKAKLEKEHARCWIIVVSKKKAKEHQQAAAQGALGSS
jgi:hypothetical protein